MLISATRIITSEKVLTPGYVEIHSGVIEAVGEGAPPRPADVDLKGTVTAGFVDVHCHGGGGASFVTDNHADIDRVLQSHRDHGTTTMIASLVTAGLPDLRNQIAILAERVQQGDLAGIHLEGPWLSPRFAGAHDPALLRAPEPTEVSDVLRHGRGTVKMVTVAPELPGGLEACRVVVGNGAVPAVGHTNIDFDGCRAAIEAGATGATHLFNAMPGIHHRNPGPVVALLEDDRVFLELVFDGVHLHPSLAATLVRIAPERALLVTDAMAAAASADGHYLLGNLDVEVSEGVARLSGKDTIAGSTLTLAKAVRHAVASGVPFAQAVRAATTVPAKYLGLVGVGDIQEGHKADLVELDADLSVTRVMKDGKWHERTGT